MKMKTKRIGSILLALLMVVTMFPVFELEASAAGTLTVSDANIGLSWTDASNSKGKATWIASGNNVTGTATGYTQYVINKKSITTKLTITNNHSEERTLAFSYDLTNGGSVSGTISGTSGNYSGVLAAGGSTTITLTSPSGSSTNTLSLTNIQLIKSGLFTTTFSAPQNGSYTVDGTAVGATGDKREKDSSQKYSLVATPASGYVFFGWYKEDVGYISYNSSEEVLVGADTTIYPVFISNTVALFGVGGSKFYDLTEACNYATSASTKTVVLLNNGTVSGSHTIPKGVTLLVPFDSANTVYTSAPGCTSSAGNNVAWVQPTAYKTLTLASDAKITVNGAISVSGKHAASNGGKPYCGAPTGPVGWVKMLSGSEIIVNSGANLYAWGFIQGAGTVTAKDGATVYENFQFTDFRGGTHLAALTDENLVFPINQYYVQNIEVPVKFEAGSKESLYTSFYGSGMCVGSSTPFIGEGGMFVIESGYVEKDYIEGADRLQIEAYGNISLSSMSVKVSAFASVNSATYMLPMNNNVTINMWSGTTTVNQSVALFPGVEMYIGKDATLVIGANSSDMLTDKNEYNSGGYHLIVYDRDEWFYGYDLEKEEIAENLNFVFGDGSDGRFNPLRYAPGRTYERSADDIKDAVLDVNGTIIVNGGLYTTLGGGAVKSSEKTGTIVMESGSGPDMLTFQAVGGTSYGVFMNSASLMNGDGSYLATGPNINDDTILSTEPGTTFNYCATHDKWYAGECDLCSGGCNHKPVTDSAVAPTCTVTGLTEGSHCELCGEVLVAQDVVPALGHKETTLAGKDATCTEAGLTEGKKCTVCGVTTVAQKEITALGHKETTVAGKDATCTDAGLTEGKKCTVCGVTTVAQETIDALGHDYDDGVINPEPTCNDDGVKTFTCGNCGDTYTEAVSAKGHTEGETVVENK